MKNNFEKYYQAVKYLESIPIMPKADYFTKKSSRSLFLKRTQYFLNLLGNPEKDFKYIHVSGSSGKGSVATMIHQILVKAGYNAGLFTSPYLTTSIEKIKVKNLFISPNDFSKIVNQIKPAVAKAKKHSPYGRPSYFEIFFAISLLYFKQKKCDFIVVEVGLGGRYDATNIIPSPKATVINLIDFDHVDILGQKLTTIAAEKAAIIKPKTKVFTTNKNEKSVINVIKKVCQKQNVPLSIVKSPKNPYKLPVLGQHQQDNAELTVQVCQTLKIAKTEVNAGLSQVKLPCRLEIIQKNPIVILDSAHNPSKMKTTSATIKNLTYEKLYLIIALTHNRNPNKVFESLIPLANSIFVTHYSNNFRHPYKPATLVNELKLNKNKGAKIFYNPHMALQKALKQAEKTDLILVTGSFYLAGELRKQWRKEYKILKERKI